MGWRPSLCHISFGGHLPNYSRVGHNSHGISWDGKYISCTTTCTWEYIVEWSWGGHEHFPCYWPGRTGMYWLYCCHHTLQIHSLSFLRNLPQTTASQVSLVILHLVVVGQEKRPTLDSSMAIQKFFLDLAPCFCYHSHSCWIIVPTKEFLPHGCNSYQTQLTLFLSALVVITSPHSS